MRLRRRGKRPESGGTSASNLRRAASPGAAEGGEGARGVPEGGAMAEGGPAARGGDGAALGERGSERRKERERGRRRRRRRPPWPGKERTGERRRSSLPSLAAP